MRQFRLLDFALIIALIAATIGWVLCYKEFTGRVLVHTDRNARNGPHIQQELKWIITRHYPSQEWQDAEPFFRKLIPSLATMYAVTLALAWWGVQRWSNKKSF